MSHSRVTTPAHHYRGDMEQYDLKGESAMQVSAAGIAWYRSQDYDRLKTMFPDGWKLPDTFEEWLEIAQILYDKLTADGHLVVKAYIDPNTFPEWCRAKGMEMDADARMDFGNDCAAAHHRAKSQ
jgi:hypothetical protein